MQNEFWRLQIFADGGGDGGTASGGEGNAAAGVTPADAGQGNSETIRDRLRKMGVPEDRLQNRAYDAPAAKGTPNAEQAQTADAGQNAEAAAPPQQQEQKKKPSFKELLDSDPDYNADAQKMVSKRVAKYRAASEAMEAMGPAIEMMAKHYGMDMANMDYKALANAVLEDDSYYQQRALDMGVSVDLAKKLETAERLEDARRRDEEMSERQRQIQQHIAGLYTQGEQMKAKYPDFDLDRELQNDQFAKLTAPGVNVSVEEAYFLVHREELMENARRATVQNLSQTIQAGQNRPNETGSKRGGDAPAKDVNSIRNMSKEKRAELKRRMEAGETVTAADILAMA